MNVFQVIRNNFHILILASPTHADYSVLSIPLTSECNFLIIFDNFILNCFLFLARRLPPSLLDPSISNAVLNYPAGSNIEIPIPLIDSSFPNVYMWMKDREIVDEDRYICFSSKSHLLIQNVQVFHGGIYVCHVDNSFGHLEVPVVLEISEGIVRF